MKSPGCWQDGRNWLLNLRGSAETQVAAEVACVSPQVTGKPILASISGHSPLFPFKLVFFKRAVYQAPLLQNNLASQIKREKHQCLWTHKHLWTSIHLPTCGRAHAHVDRAMCVAETALKSNPPEVQSPRHTHSKISLMFRIVREKIYISGGKRIQNSMYSIITPILKKDQ